MKRGSVDSKKYFEKVAAKWDGLRQSFFSEALREKAMTAAGVQRGRLAVDVGAGTGFLTEGLIMKGLRVIAVDQSEAMLEQMKKKYANSNRVDFRRGEADGLPVADESADYVFANMLLHHVENPSAAISEMARVLKKDGSLVITDLDEHSFEFLRKEQSDRWMGFKRQEIKEWFRQAGLKNVRVECANEDCCAQSINGDESAKISIFMAVGEKRASTH